jgi:hypothetical protein
MDNLKLYVVAEEEEESAAPDADEEAEEELEFAAVLAELPSYSEHLVDDEMECEGADVDELLPTYGEACLLRSGRRAAALNLGCSLARVRAQNPLLAARLASLGEATGAACVRARAAVDLAKCHALAADERLCLSARARLVAGELSAFACGLDAAVLAAEDGKKPRGFWPTAAFSLSGVVAQLPTAPPRLTALFGRG